jgi:hypothetical protein
MQLQRRRIDTAANCAARMMFFGCICYNLYWCCMRVGSLLAMAAGSVSQLDIVHHSQQCVWLCAF